MQKFRFVLIVFAGIVALTFSGCGFMADALADVAIGDSTSRTSSSSSVSSDQSRGVGGYSPQLQAAFLEKMISKGMDDWTFQGLRDVQVGQTLPDGTVMVRGVVMAEQPMTGRVIPVNDVVFVPESYVR